MGVRTRITEGAAQYLRNGEQVQFAFPARDTNRFFAVVVTDRRILIFRQTLILAKPTGEPVAELARVTVIGPPRGFTYFSKGLHGLRIGLRYYRDVVAATAPGLTRLSLGLA